MTIMEMKLSGKEIGKQIMIIMEIEGQHLMVLIENIGNGMQIEYRSYRNEK